MPTIFGVLKYFCFEVQLIKFIFLYLSNRKLIFFSYYSFIILINFINNAKCEYSHLEKSFHFSSYVGSLALLLSFSKLIAESRYIIYSFLVLYISSEYSITHQRAMANINSDL